MSEHIPSFLDFVADSRMSLVAAWFRDVEGIHVEIVGHRWTDLLGGASGTDAVSLVQHVLGVCAETAIGLIRLGEETGGKIIPNKSAGPNARALKIEFPDEGESG